jgi:sugar lactone lactonase YvrE
MSYPYDIRVDAGGRQFVCEFGNSRIQVFDAEDRLIEILGGTGREPGQFNNPWSIALDSQGNLIVADSQNHRVQKLWRRRERAEKRETKLENRIGALDAMGHSFSPCDARANFKSPTHLSS